MRGFALIAIATALWAGCGDGDEAPEPPASGPLVVYERSGGVAGVVEQLRVEADGQATVTSGPERARETFRLGAEELALLESQLDDADLSIPPEGPPGCADCFEYAISAGGETVRFDQLADPAEPIGMLLRHLGEIVAAHQPA